ncbi:MAG: class I SAM-dependent methyltransferase [Anaerolineae bacterium]
MSRVNYDEVAPTYNQRYADGEIDGVARHLFALVKDLEAERVLEVGCGTGHWLHRLSPLLPEVCGLDLSRGMLSQMESREGLCRAQGRGGRLPFVDAAFDLVYCVNAIHHFEEQRAFVFEARRLLRSCGALAVVGSVPQGRFDSWYVYKYFPGTYATDLRRFPSWGTVLDWMVDAGFETATLQLVRHVVDPKLGRAVLDDPFLQKNSASQLILLSDEDYAEGLRRIRADLAAAEAAGENLVFNVDLKIYGLVGWCS